MADDHEVQSSTEDEVPVESLIKGRAKRSTAGNHMSALLNAEADDDLALLFEEIEDDNEFADDAEEEGAEEDDMAMDSSSDDDDDQGPSARADDFEGEKQIEKDEKTEKKKRRLQQDLRFKIARKKVKIDPTAVAESETSAAAASRPKKKSERISWIPTPEDGPVRSSSRRQTMHNKELTHARLKDSEEKRVRLIATMEEAAKRKAHLKPKEMTQVERLAEAARVEKHNSKILNRWEEMEKRKAEERRAKIEALQNRRLEGPVMSHWSGIATWVDGRITRIGKVDITPKPEKEDNTRRKSSKKSDKDEKNVTEQKTTENASAEPATSQPAPPTTTETPADSAPPTAGEPVKQNQETTQIQPTTTDSIQESGTNPENAAPKTDGANTSVTSTVPEPAAGQSSISTPGDTPGTETAPVSTAQDVGPEQPMEIDTKMTDDSPKDEKAKATHTNEKDLNEKIEEKPKEPTQEPSQVPNASTPKSEKQENPDSLPAGEKSGDMSEKPVLESSASTSLDPGNPTVPKEPSPTAAPAPAAVDTATAPDGVPDGNPPPTQPVQPSETTTPTQKEQEAPVIHVDQATGTNDGVPQPEVPQPPPVIEHTGRNLTVLENFDDKTAQSREFSIYFNAKKPPRLTKISSSLCVITSLPSRYRDPDTSLPFANAYAYHEIRHTVDQKYAWSPMLGCYVGPSGVAARGVPERFLGGPQAGTTETKDDEKKDSSNNGGEPAVAETDKEGDTKAPDGVPSTPAPPATPTPVAAGAGEPMDIDKPEAQIAA